MRAIRPQWMTFLTIGCAAVLAACAPESNEMADDAPQAAAPTPAPAPATVSVTPPQPEPESVDMNIPDVITAERGGFVPEGIEYDRANGRFLTGSLADGSIYEVGLDGSLTAFIMDPALVSSVGIEADEARDRLLVTNSNAAVFGMPLGNPDGPPQAQLGAYSLTTGERLAMVDLAAEVNTGDDAVFFANDVAVADDGTAYVTDTQQNVVYRVGTDYDVSIHYAFDAIEGLALNGIEWHEDGYLIVADLGNGRFYKVTTTGRADADMIAVPEALAGADGLVWRDDGALAVTQNSPTDGRVTLLTSDDGWLTASIAGVSTHAGQATTSAAVGGDIYSVQPHFADAEAPTIHRATF